MPNSLLEHPEVRALLTEGAREVAFLLRRINDLLGDLEIDALDAEDLFEALEDRAIAVDDSKIRRRFTPSTLSSPQRRHKMPTKSDAEKIETIGPWRSR